MVAEKRRLKGARPRGQEPMGGASVLRPVECRELLRRTLAGEYPSILDTFVRAAKKGSAAHMKLATDLLERRAKDSRGAPEAR
jgi:hypothetical protein